MSSRAYGIPLGLSANWMNNSIVGQVTPDMWVLLNGSVLARLADSVSQAQNSPLGRISLLRRTNLLRSRICLALCARNQAADALGRWTLFSVVRAQRSQILRGCVEIGLDELLHGSAPETMKDVADTAMNKSAINFEHLEK
jgi:hypothetical protein